LDSFRESWLDAPSCNAFSSAFERKFPLEPISRCNKKDTMSPSTQNALGLAIGILFSAAASSSAQTTAVTDPVGFITLNIAGTTGGATSALSFKGLSMTRAIEYQGSAETVGTNTLVDNEATWTDNQFNGANGSYFVEITNGTNVGATFDIQATAAATKTITLAQNLPTGSAAPLTFKVRKHWTIGSVFGAANEVGLGGGDATTADQILIFNGVGYDTYYYQTSGLGGVGWRKGGDVGTNAANTVLFPEDGIIIKRKQAGAVNVVLLGAVKMGTSSIPVAPGNNVIANVYAASITLGSSGLYTGNAATGLAGGASTSADQVLLWNGVSYDVFYYQTSGLGGTGWRKGGDVGTDAASTAIPSGASLIIKRQGASGFNWVVPQHPASI
jgi:uncharacterized protein (TIGR02597 family)